MSANNEYLVMLLPHVNNPKYKILQPERGAAYSILYSLRRDNDSVMTYKTASSNPRIDHD